MSHKNQWENIAYLQGQRTARSDENLKSKKKNTKVVDKLHVLFTNADSLLNKRTELEYLINEQDWKPLL